MQIAHFPVILEHCAMAQSDIDIKRIMNVGKYSYFVYYYMYSILTYETNTLLLVYFFWYIIWTKNITYLSFLLQNHKTKKFTHKSKAYAGSTGPRVNSSSMLYAAKHNDYERVKILYRYGYRLERVGDKITGKKIF